MIPIIQSAAASIRAVLTNLEEFSKFEEGPSHGSIYLRNLTSLSSIWMGEMTRQWGELR